MRRIIIIALAIASCLVTAALFKDFELPVETKRIMLEAAGWLTVVVGAVFLIGAILFALLIQNTRQKNDQEQSEE